MRPFFFLPMIAMFSSTVAFALPPKNIDKDYWAGTGLKIDDFIRTQVGHCNDDGLHILGCVQAANTLASATDSPVYFATAAEATNNPNAFGQLVQTSPSGLNIYEPNPHPTSLSQEQVNQDFIALVGKMKDRKELHSTEIQALANNAAKVDFQHLFERLKADFQKGKYKDKEESVTADIFNANYAIVIDPHTRLWSVAEEKDMYAADDESFVGIGVSLMVVKDEVVIESDAPNSPALAAGVKMGDVILEVDGNVITPKSAPNVSTWIRGPENQAVKLKVRRKGQIMEINVIRAKIVTKNVDISIISDDGVKYGVIKLGSFMDKKSGYKISEAIAEFQAAGVKGYIVDLRNNGGGLLIQAMLIGSIFMGEQNIVGIKDLQTDNLKFSPGYSAQYLRTHASAYDEDTQKPYYIEHTDYTTPMVVLINGHSASASEILAGALQDNKRAWVLGTRSYGKATVQQPVDNEIDPTNKTIDFYKTVARFYQPSGRTNQIVGITPNFSIDAIMNATPMQKYFSYEGDNYTALPPLSAPWQETRVSEVNNINRCRAQRVKSGKSADQHYKTLFDQQTVMPDYQLFSAEDVLTCMH